SAVAASASAAVSGVYAGVTKVGSLSVTPPALASVSMNPASLLGGVSSTGTVSLSGPAPVGGAVVTLTDDSAAANTPASVTVSAGQTAATFTVSTTAVAVVTNVTISGSFNGTQSGVLTLNPGGLVSVSMNPTSVNGGSSSTGTVTLSA